jgi:hypothetical protein
VKILTGLILVVALWTEWPIAVSAGTATQAATPNHEQFQHPPNSARILKIIHGWPDDPLAQDRLIAGLARQGFGGVVCNVSFQDYVQSASHWQAFVRAVTTAKSNGFNLWLYDERGYPSGSAGGQVLRQHPEWEAEGLLIATAEAAEGQVLSLDTPPGNVVAAAALPFANQSWSRSNQVDLSHSIRNQKLQWHPPAGRWKIVVITRDRLFEGTHAAMNLADKLPYPNLLMREPTTEFLRLTHEQYARQLGQNLGRFFEAAFTDEPSLMSLFLRPMPYRVLPWSPQLAVEFKRRRGYLLEPNLTALVTDCGRDTAKIRYDYWHTISELVSENYFGQIQNWCRGHGLPSGGHLLMEEGLATHVPLYGDFFQCLRRLDAPGIDCLTSVPADVPWQIARLAASAAELENHPLVMCEVSDHSQVYRPADDRRPPRIVTEQEIRGTLNRLMVNGINRFTSYYTFRGLADKQLQQLSDYAGRACSWLEGGQQAASIAVLYPAASIWVRFEPSRLYANDAARANQIESIYHNVSESLFADGRDFTFIDAQAIADARVRDGALQTGAHRWRVVILPGADTLPLAAWRNLRRLVESGGVLICLGHRPANSDQEFPAPEVQRTFARILPGLEGEPGFRTFSRGGTAVFLPRGFEYQLPLLLDQLIERECTPQAPAPAIHATHRRRAGQEIFFVCNDSPETWTGNLRCCASGTGEEWNPGDGNVAQIADSAAVALQLAPYESRILTFKTGREPHRLTAPSHLLPRLEYQPLTFDVPTVGKGEFVRTDLLPEVMPDQPAITCWRSRSRITRSNVDTFSFVMFPARNAQGFVASTALAIDSWTPAGQSSPTQLLVILRERGGADYFATLGRPLSAAGFDRTLIPWHRFKLAGWSTDNNGTLDRDQITEVRVGWGGYYGAENESVEFSLSPPQAVVTR